MAEGQRESARQVAADVLRREAACLERLADDLGASFEATVDLLSGLPGRVLVSGLGKSGLVGAKIAATLASTGTVASFVHAADALHGDAGMITPQDVLVAISNSGTTPEVVQVAGMASDRGTPVVAITREPLSALGVVARVVLRVDVGREADPLDLAPTSSTTAVMALGDALAVALMQRRGFGPEDFAVNHPGGALGARSSTTDASVTAIQTN